jgi:hypothetical protein
MATPAMALVEASRVTAVELTHAGRERRYGGLDDEVVVRRHQAPSVKCPAPSAPDADEATDERRSIEVIDDEHLVGGAAPRVSVEEAIAQDVARSARHRRTVARETLSDARRDQNGAVLIHAVQVTVTETRPAGTGPGDCHRDGAAKATAACDRQPRP